MFCYDVSLKLSYLCLGGVDKRDSAVDRQGRVPVTNYAENLMVLCLIDTVMIESTERRKG